MHMRGPRTRERHIKGVKEPLPPCCTWTHLAASECCDDLDACEASACNGGASKVLGVPRSPCRVLTAQAAPKGCDNSHASRRSHAMTEGFEGAAVSVLRLRPWHHL